MWVSAERWILVVDLLFKLAQEGRRNIKKVR